MPKHLYASICKEVRSKGAGGACLYWLFSILSIDPFFWPFTFFITLSASFFSQNLSFLCHASIASFLTSPFSWICQKGTGLNALISFSLSTIIFRAGPWTLPVDIILNIPAVFIAWVKALL